MSWKRDGEIISAGSVNFSYPKYFRYEDPQLTCRVIGDEIEVTASAYAKSVEILNGDEDLILSDNYFDMNAGTKRVKIEHGECGQVAAEKCVRYPVEALRNSANI